MPRFLGGLLVSLVAISAAIGAPETGTVRLEGVLMDQERQRLGNVTLVATHVDTGLERSATTDERGYFELGMMPLGAYRFRGGDLLKLLDPRQIAS
ncbi:MAG: carboxypeptidase-like regulatory domain-containing protein, partial [Gammaproteobacteria bacterium]|nr:carboxypeptidase-like regulatory domain-containing protein [Gammaproteobacteria bacterium]